MSQRNNSAYPPYDAAVKEWNPESEQWEPARRSEFDQWKQDLRYWKKNRGLVEARRRARRYAEAKVRSAQAAYRRQYPVGSKWQ